MYIYHYAAFRTNRDGKAVWMDGLATNDNPLETDEQYSALKQVIADQNDLPVHGLVITSLSLISKPAAAVLP